MSAVDMKNVIKVTKGGLEAMDRALGMFNREMDHVVPWTMYQEKVKEFEVHAGAYSKESAGIVGEIKTQMLNVRDNYLNTSQVIVELSGSSSKVLNIYLGLLTQMSTTTYPAQRTFIIKTLTDCVSQFSDGMVRLQHIAVNLIDMATKIAGLINQFNIDFDGESKFFKAKLNEKSKKDNHAVDEKLIAELHTQLAEVMNFFVGIQVSVDKAIVDLKGVKDKVDVEIVQIVEVKDKVEAAAETSVTANDMNEYRHSIENLVYNFVAQCKEYQKRHAADK